MIELKDGAVIVSGAITLETVPDLVNAIAEHLDHGTRHIDLSRVAEVDSSAVALLLEWQRQATSRGASLSWGGMPAALQNLANLYGVQELLPVEA